MDHATDHATAEQAAHNNAVFCDAVCRAHGHPGEFLGRLWLNRHAAPRFYPNLVTLTPDASTDALAQVAALRDAGLPRGWGVKDSFCALDLGPMGFRVLFEAQWLCRAASRPRPRAEIPGLRWGRVTEAAALADWEAAWGAGNAGTSRVFPKALLAEEAIAFVAGYQGERIVAGAIANLSDDGRGAVAGVSNLFLPAEDGERFRAGCVAAISDVFPGLPMVGYEGGSDLAGMEALGFQRAGGLRVWLLGG